MSDDPPKLRLVDPDERPVAGPPEPPADEVDLDAPGQAPWLSALVTICVAVAVLVVGLAFSLKLLLDTGDDESSGDDQSVAAVEDTALIGVPSTTTPPVAAVTPTSSPAGAAPAPTTPASTVAPSLIPLPVTGGAAVAAPVTTPPPVTGSARLRIFNGYRPGLPLEVWEVSGDTPVRYGTVPYAGLVEAVANGQRLPGGVELQLRFVVPGGNPLDAKGENGPWTWNITPADGSSQSLMLSDNGGLRVLRIDNLRAIGAASAGRTHVVPVVFHLVLEGTRTKRWAADGVGCLGPTTTDNTEFDVVPGTALRLSSADDGACATTVAGPVVVDQAGAVAVVGVETVTGGAQLFAVPLA